MKLRVFISWSGDRSKAVAVGLRDWLPRVIQAVDPWFSDNDILPGQRWSAEIAEQLSTTNFGIICVTTDNQHAPWLQFEAGALAKTVDEKTFVVPYLVGVGEEELTGPLAQLHYVRADRSGTWKLLSALNSALATNGIEQLDPAQLSDTFEMWWPNLQQSIDAVPELASLSGPERSQRDIMREVLELVRGLSYKIDALPGSELEGLSREATSVEDWNPPYAVGDEVTHPKFGKGTVLAVHGRGFRKEVTVKFTVGTKRLLAKYANLSHRDG